MDYVEASKAKNMSGLRLALTAGVPGPWSESAKSVFHVKSIDYTPVFQAGGMDNADLEAWTGHRNAPVAVYENERARTGWAEILLLAERLAPEPKLIPEDPEERALMFGISHEICGELGFGWCRRLMFIDEIFERSTEPDDLERRFGQTLGDFYGYSPEVGKAARKRVSQVLALLAERLHSQRTAGSSYLVGDQLSVADIYWACFAALVSPLPEEVNPMPPMVRAWYASSDPVVNAALDPILIEHRDNIYANHLKLPLDF